MIQVLASSNVRAGGMSAGFPCGAPLSAHLPTLAISSALNEGSFLYFWMPMFFSMYQGGMTPRCGPMEVRCLIAFAQGRTSSYDTRDIGATPSGRWQFWQLRARTGAMSFANVTLSGTAAGSARRDTTAG